MLLQAVSKGLATCRTCETAAATQSAPDRGSRADGVEDHDDSCGYLHGQIPAIHKKVQVRARARATAYWYNLESRAAKPEDEKSNDEYAGGLYRTPDLWPLLHHRLLQSTALIKDAQKQIHRPLNSQKHDSRRAEEPAATTT